MSIVADAKRTIREAALPKELLDLIGGHLDRKTIELMADMHRSQTGETLPLEQVIPSLLEESFNYVVELKRKRIIDETLVPLGSSKYRGLPHLPTALPWPEGAYFAAQLDLSTLHPYDLEQILPESGMLYLFFYMNRKQGTLIHFDGPKSALKVTSYPDASTLPGAEHYLEDFLAESALLELEPKYFFDGSWEETAKICELLPVELKARLDALLNCTVTDENPIVRLFGPAQCWQGDEEQVEQSGRWMLFQDDFGEGNIHFWLEEPVPKNARLDCGMSHSGT